MLLADDQAIVRSGLRTIVEAGGFQVVAEAADGWEAVSEALRLRPDVCLVDIRMPGLDGLEVTSRLAGPTVDRPIPVVVVTTFDHDDYVLTAIANGASGFILKDAGPALLLEAIRAAVAGDALVSPSITLRLFGRRLGPDQERSRPPDPVSPLTGREEEVLLAVAAGCTNAEIGDRLYISLSTVKTHVASLQAKLGARNRVELAHWAWSTGRMGPH